MPVMGVWVRVPLLRQIRKHTAISTSFLQRKYSINGIMRLRRHSQEISVRIRLNMFSVYGGLLKLVKRMLLKSIRSVMSWRGGSNPSTSAKRMFTDTLGTQMSTPQHFFKQCDIYIKNNNLE